MDKSKLFQNRLPESDVEIPGVGTVRVRALSRYEVMLVQGSGLGVAEQEDKILAYAMVDPSMSEKDVEKWRKAALVDDIELVTDTIQEISGLRDSADKDAMLGFRDEPSA